MNGVAAQNAAVVVLASYGEREWDAARDAVSANSEVVEVPTGESWKGPDGLVAEFERWAAGFSDSRSEFLNIFEQGDFVCVEAIWKGTHDGDLVFPDVTLPPSGRPLAFPYCTVARLQDGKQVSSKHYYDLGTVLEQLQFEGSDH